MENNITFLRILLEREPRPHGGDWLPNCLLEIAGLVNGLVLWCLICWCRRLAPARALADLLGPEKEMTAVARKERRVRDH